MKFIFTCLSLFAAMSAMANGTLNIYGPGGPSAPISEAAEIFSARKGVKINVIFGPQQKWINKALENADLVYGGAEYMLTNIELQHKGFINRKERYELYPRKMSILVRKGNPKNIRTLQDLAKPGIKILDVNGAGQLGLWEDIAGKVGLIESIQKNNSEPLSSNAEGVAAWKADSSYDAWINFSSWQKVLGNHADKVEIPQAINVIRGTPIALTHITKNPELAKEFIAFMKTKEGKAIFRKHGWN
ncbi:substrate-binding domain-containing protein [Neisseria iguanae]|uniref:ABC transporter substrate-binding protein n=1 Tax=Neisseria iguanae TaxID=90242 RepID=A0A2P7U0J2_9NEIS|nr:substrate-binding domain-containing protein [Neisseria iguanae]PSJ80496.1 hypothetical protein C7N83_06035 [Neisseria iguanae]